MRAAECLGTGCSRPVRGGATALHVSAYSLTALVGAFRPLLQRALGGASVVGLDFDATRAWPVYDWMGVMKAGLESLCRYIARELGPGEDPREHGGRRAGPHDRREVHPGVLPFEDTWSERAPLGWDVYDSSAVADTAVAMLSPLLRGTTASVVYVDGGFHSMG